MKQLLFTLILFLSGINILQAQETNSIEETTWNVIRERLFSGENTKAYRFEEDIRFQLKGEFTKEDSLVIQNIINELKSLIEIVDVKLVNENGNFIINILSADSGIEQNFNYRNNGAKIYYTELWFSFKEGTLKEMNEKEIRYYVFRHLTRIFENKSQFTFYGGVYDQPFLKIMPLHVIDKDLIAKLYSTDFYKQLRKNTVKKWGYLSYLKLRYENLVKIISLSIKLALVIFGFLFFLSNESKRVKHPSLWVYVKQRTIILLIIPFIFSFDKKIGDLSSFLITSPGLFMVNFLVVVIYAFLVLILIYYSEPYFLKKINGFTGKQIFLFLSTIAAPLIIFITIILSFYIILFLLHYRDSTKNSIAYSGFIHNSSFPFIIVFIATLRVFYNFINYRMQSMVNQKDVELAKMKELKNQAELNALHSRINPHFLYNSLNSIASLAHINPDKTENMAVALSEIFRYSINKENKTFVTVEEELEMVKKYLEIEKTRFGDKLNYTIIADETVKEKLIPKFLIQPLAENAIKHGLSKITEAGRIAIEVKQLENDLVIAIFDSGPDFPEEPVSGYGLQNLNDKLEIIYGKDAFISWENGENKHFKITIKNQFK